MAGAQDRRVRLGRLLHAHPAQRRHRGQPPGRPAVGARQLPAHHLLLLRPAVARRRLRARHPHPARLPARREDHRGHRPRRQPERQGPPGRLGLPQAAVGLERPERDRARAQARPGRQHEDPRHRPGDRHRGHRLDDRDLPGPLVRELAADGTLAGLKDSSGDEGSLRRLIVELGGRRGRADGPAPAFSILTGSELTVDAALLAGADGVVPGLGNVDPAGYVRLHDAVRGGDLDRAVNEQERLVELFGMVDAGPEDEMGRNSSAIGAFKHALRLLGVFAHGTTAAPQIQLGDASIARVEERLRGAGLLPVR
ncbi:dihydrodipicolinate synthase [Streptomyces viridosporus ATCC 14672]|uniref:Dihydrodipicolinate synthase n=1 Tax=Streptomyces viridosporus (strain ATCC 14672 / DSM 40746 / JCM 4963 / KCTC 9882 / NRRL B-12104 / FH 1290) TaxID=566461 RepID=D6A7I4_STRV1|nr:dihydrodipicolinate synthase [Streptomyces viridosporus ATCC 14672]